MRNIILLALAGVVFITNEKSNASQNSEDSLLVHSVNHTYNERTYDQLNVDFEKSLKAKKFDQAAKFFVLSALKGHSENYNYMAHVDGIIDLLKKDKFDVHKINLRLSLHASQNMHLSIL